MLGDVLLIEEKHHNAAEQILMQIKKSKREKYITTYKEKSVTMQISFR